MTAKPPTSISPPSGTPPHGLTDVDYEAIEAAVTETVRGRWFLNEFARRNRGAEVKLMLDAMVRLETMVGANQAQAALAPPPSADPSIRLLVQRIKDIAAGLDAIAGDMRDEGIEPHFWERVDAQARAVAGLMRTGPTAEPRPAPLDRAVPLPARLSDEANGPDPHSPTADKAAAASPPPPEAGVLHPARALDTAPVAAPPRDPRLAALSGLDRLPLAKKLALFT